MITAVFYKKSGNLSGFKVSGHAEYDDFGLDIVCASVTSAVQLTCNLITDYFKFKSDVSAENNTVTLKVVDINEEASLIIDNLRNHLKLISEEFENAIIIKISEV